MATYITSLDLFELAKRLLFDQESRTQNGYSGILQILGRSGEIHDIDENGDSQSNYYPFDDLASRTVILRQPPSKTVKLEAVDDNLNEIPGSCARWIRATTSAIV